MDFPLQTNFLCECYGILGYNKFCSPRLECCCSLFEACRKGPGKLAHLWAPSVRCCADLRSFAKSENRRKKKQHPKPSSISFWDFGSGFPARINHGTSTSDPSLAAACRCPRGIFEWFSSITSHSMKWIRGTLHKKTWLLPPNIGVSGKLSFKLILGIQDGFLPRVDYRPRPSTR